MQLVRWPKQFDVIVTDNLFGDLLSDCAAMCTGSLGMLPSASLGAADESGRRRAMYEPVHGSAPDIAGEKKANPLATILSFAMCLRYSFDMGEDADNLEKACANVPGGGLPHRRRHVRGRDLGFDRGNGPESLRRSWTSLPHRNPLRLGCKANLQRRPPAMRGWLSTIIMASSPGRLRDGRRACSRSPAITVQRSL